MDIEKKEMAIVKKVNQNLYQKEMEKEENTIQMKANYHLKVLI